MPSKRRHPERERLCGIFPQLSRDGLHLYAIGYADGRLKIGVTGKPKARMVEHFRADGSMVWSHLFCQISGAYAAERHVIRLLQSAGNRIANTEVFTGIDRETAIPLIRSAIASWRRIPQRAPANQSEAA